MDLFSIYLHIHVITAGRELIVLLISVQLAGASNSTFLESTQWPLSQTRLVCIVGPFVLGLDECNGLSTPRVVTTLCFFAIMERKSSSDFLFSLIQRNYPGPE